MERTSLQLTSGDAGEASFFQDQKSDQKSGRNGVLVLSPVFDALQARIDREIERSSLPPTIITELESVLAEIGPALMSFRLLRRDSHLASRQWAVQRAVEFVFAVSDFLWHRVELDDAESVLTLLQKLEDDARAVLIVMDEYLDRDDSAELAVTREALAVMHKLEEKLMKDLNRLSASFSKARCLLFGERASVYERVFVPFWSECTSALE